MKLSVRITSFIVCLIITLSYFMTVNASNISTDESEVVLQDQKVYSNATIDQKFADNRVIVVMDGNVG